MQVGYKQSDLLSRDKQKLNWSIISNQAAFFTIAIPLIINENTRPAQKIISCLKVPQTEAKLLYY